MSALRALKYRGIRDVADIFAEKLADKISAGTFGTWPEGEMLLVPIPTTRASARARGYNQSLLLAEALAQRAPERFIVGKDILSKKEIKNLRLADKVEIETGKIVEYKST